MSDPYKVLGVPRTATVDEIKRAYRKLAHEHHPDKGGNAEKFKEINEAYQQIKDGKPPSSSPFEDIFRNARQGGAQDFYGQGFADFVRQREEDVRRRQEEMADLLRRMNQQRGMYDDWFRQEEPRKTTEQVRKEWMQKLKAEQERHKKKMQEIHDWFTEALRKAI